MGFASFPAGCDVVTLVLREQMEGGGADIPKCDFLALKSSPDPRMRFPDGKALVNFSEKVFSTNPQLSEEVRNGHDATKM